MDEDPLSNSIIGAAIEVHRALGPGLLESAYKACLAYELQQHGLVVELEVDLPIRYKGVYLDCGYRIDMIVERKVIVELKSVQAILPVHEAQLLTYLRLTECKVGLILNFNVHLMKRGIKRLVLNL